MGLGRWAAHAAAAGTTLFAVGAIFHVMVPRVVPTVSARFADAGLFRPWGGWTSTYMALHPFGFGVAFAAVYLALLDRGGLAPGWRDGLRFGLGVFLIGALPVFLLAFAAFQMTPDVLMSWLLQAACQDLAAGAVLGVLAGRGTAK